MALRTTEFLQTKTYSALRDRVAFQHGGGVQPGIWDMGDFIVSQRASGANMSVDVSAGYALVAANDPGNAGLYHQQNDATTNVATQTNGSAWAAGHATLPRVDRVVLLINDTTDGGDASDTPILGVIQGTATASATLDNLTGAASLPTGSLLLANVLMPAAATTVVTANIRDRRPSARQGWFKVMTSVASGTSISFPGLTLWGGVDHVEIRGRVRSLRAAAAHTGLRFTVNAIGGTGYIFVVAVDAVPPSAATATQASGYIGQAAAALSDSLGQFELHLNYANTITTSNVKQYHAVMSSWISSGTLFANERPSGILPASMINSPLTSVVITDDVGSNLDTASVAELWVFGG